MTVFESIELYVLGVYFKIKMNSVFSENQSFFKTETRQGERYWTCFFEVTQYRSSYDLDLLWFSNPS